MSDPGTGKTRVQIELFVSRYHRGGGKALVIAPRSLLKSAWYDDFHKYAPSIKCSIARANNRAEAFNEVADVYITNTDAVKWLVQQKPAFFKPFDTLIVDEISYFKHHTSQRSKALNKIKKYFKHRYGLTGTPNGNSITDIWNQANIVDDGQRLGTSFYGFRASVCSPTQVGPQANMIKWTDRPGAEQAVAGLLRDITIRHEFEKCTDIPKNHEYAVNYELGPNQARVYNDMVKNAIAEMQDGRRITALNAAVVTTKLLQIASGAVYSEIGTYILLDRGRYELIAELIEERKHCVVFFNWQHQRDELIKEFQARNITHTVLDGSTTDKQRDEAVRLFQGGFYRVMLAHPQSAAHGLTLTKGTSTIWASPTFNLEHYLQGNKRIYRVGQTEKTETVMVLGEDTLDEEVYQRLKAKNLRQGELLGLLQKACVPQV